MTKKDWILFLFYFFVFGVIGYLAYSSYKSGLYKQMIADITNNHEIYASSMEESITVGETVTIKNDIPNDINEEKVTWTSSNPSVATVDKGTVKGLKNGTTTIESKINNKIITKNEVTVYGGEVNLDDEDDNNKDNTKTEPKKEENKEIIIKPSSISLNTNELTLTINKTYKLKASVIPNNAEDTSVTWSTSDSSIVSVSNGEIKALKVGTANITVKTVNNITASCKVIVKDIEFENISFKNKNENINKNGSITLTPIINPVDYKNYKIYWSSSDTKVANVDQNGKVTGVSVGKANITATVNNKSATISITVIENIIKATNIKVSENNIKMTIGDTKRIDYEVLPQNATNKSVKITSSDNTIISVKDNVITALKDGEAIITLSLDNIKSVIKVTVESIKVSSIEIDNTNFSVSIGSSKTLKATAYPSNAKDKTIKWTTSNANIAKVDSNGKVTGINEGTCNIFASHGDIRTKAIVKVTPVLAKKITLNKEKVGILKGSSETLTATITPSNTTNKTIAWSSSDTNIVKVDKNGKITAKKEGFATITATVNSVSTTTLVKVYKSSDDYVKTYFLNTQNHSKMATKYVGNQSILLETRDFNFILFDTANSDDDIVKVIYSRVKSLQNKQSKIVIDYIVLSHLDSDHYGNLVSILNNSKIVVKNLVIKYEKTVLTAIKNRRDVFNNVIKAVKEKNIHLYISSNAIVNNKVTVMKTNGKDEVFDGINYSVLKEEQKINVGNYLSMYLFNVNDVYEKYGSSKCTGGTRVKLAANPNSTEVEYYKNSNGEYIIFNNTNGTYPNVKYETTKIKAKVGVGFNRVFYAYDDGKVNICRSNANSIAVFNAIHLDDNTYKYIYITGDLENNGYSYIPTTKSGYDNKIYGNGTTNLYTNKAVFDNKTKKFNKPDNVISVPSETDVALKIKNKFGNKVKNIVIYQMSHHGINNATDAINILGLNRSNIYAVAPTATNIANTNSFLVLRSYYYTFSKVPANRKLISGNNKNGVLCNINNKKETLCKDF